MKKVARKKSYQLRYMEALGARTQLPNSQQQYVLNLKKGYEGEKRFDDLIAEHFMDGVTVLTDLLVSVNGSTAQIDALIVLEDTFYLYEVKNYEGEYQKLPGQFRKLSGQEFICPSIQLLRTKKVLQKILTQWNETYEIRPYVLFTNPAFTLFDAKISDPFILPTQTMKHLEKLSKKKASLSENCVNVINKLQSEQKSDQHYRDTSHDYNYKDMKKGIICGECQSYNVLVTERRAYCRNCKCECDINKVLLNHLEEIHMLFPDLKITSSLIYDWIGGVIVKRRIGRFLKENSIY